MQIPDAYRKNCKEILNFVAAMMELLYCTLSAVSAIYHPRNH